MGLSYFFDTINNFIRASDISSMTSILSSAAPKTGIDLDQYSANSSGPFTLRLANVVSALSRALDLSTGQPSGHSMRACVLGMRIAGEVGLPPETQSDLFYAQLLKDCGCSGNASDTFHALGSDDLQAKRDVKITDWTRISWESLQYALSHVAPGKPFLERARTLFSLAKNQKAHTKTVTKIRCQRGSYLASVMGLSAATADAILNLDEHWDGQGQPVGKTRGEIPFLSQIMLLAQTLEVFQVSAGSQSAIDVVNQRSGRWFNPRLVKAVNSLNRRCRLWTDESVASIDRLCLDSEPAGLTRFFGDSGSDATLDNICMAFSDIVDAKSPFTFNHSLGVANAAVSISQMLGLPPERILFVRHAALLHDLGKLGVSNAILEKPAALNELEWKSMKAHPFQTWSILRGIPGFEHLSEVAGSHHEKLDGTGYFRGMTAEYLPIETRILAVADIFDALAAKRPYRDSLPPERVLEIIRKDTPRAFDPLCVEALEQSGNRLDQTYVDLQNLKQKLNRSSSLS